MPRPRFWLAAVMGGFAGCVWPVERLSGQSVSPLRVPFEGVSIGVREDTSIFLDRLRRHYAVEVMMAGRLVMIRAQGRVPAPRGYIALDSTGRSAEVHREWPAPEGDAAAMLGSLHAVLRSVVDANREGGDAAAASIPCTLGSSDLESPRGPLARIEFRCGAWKIGLTAVAQPGGRVGHTWDVSLTGS